MHHVHLALGPGLAPCLHDCTGNRPYTHARSGRCSRSPSRGADRIDSPNFERQTANFELFERQLASYHAFLDGSREAKRAGSWGSQVQCSIHLAHTRARARACAFYHMIDIIFRRGRREELARARATCVYSTIHQPGLKKRTL